MNAQVVFISLLPGKKQRIIDMTEIPYKEWLEALRSEDYNQTKGTLKGEIPNGGTGYCCLGVLAEIMGYEVEEEPFEDEGVLDMYKSEGPKKIYRNFSAILGDDFVQDLIKENDEGSTFEEIADIIEREKL